MFELVMPTLFSDNITHLHKIWQTEELETGVSLRVTQVFSLNSSENLVGAVHCLFVVLSSQRLCKMGIILSSS